MRDQSQASSAVFGALAVARFPFTINNWYTDRGTEWNGADDHQFVRFLTENDITQHFTRPRTPQTNGKAERVIRTLMDEWQRKRQCATRDERRQKLYEYVDWYKHERRHGSIDATPVERLAEYARRMEDGDYAVSRTPPQRGGV